MAITYRDAGVDIDAGDRLVDRIKALAAKTTTPHVLGGIGGFAGLCRIPPGMSEPVLVSGTDGVGTKLKVAFAADRHDTIGIDLVAMCVNDIVTCGATPLFFLDYFASGKLDVDTGAAIVKGIADGCTEAGCALLGGETAEMPGMYADGEYDLAGFAVGVVERAKIVDGSRVRAGDTVLGLASSGLHSNGYSLVRRVLLDHAGLSLDARPAELGGETLADVLLRPTRIYVRAAARLTELGLAKAMCHVTGGGLPGNLPRVLPDGLGAVVDPGAWPEPPVFGLIARLGDVPRDDMRRTFNLGIGLVVVVAPSDAARSAAELESVGETVTVIGAVEEVARGIEDRVRYLR